MNHPQDLTPQGRAALATYLLMQSGGFSSKDLAERLGYRTPQGVWHLMTNISQADIPVYYDLDERLWRLGLD